MLLVLLAQEKEYFTCLIDWPFAWQCRVTFWTKLHLTKRGLSFFQYTPKWQGPQEINSSSGARRQSKMLPLWQGRKHHCGTFPCVMLKVWRNPIRASQSAERRTWGYWREGLSGVAKIHSQQPSLPVADYTWSAKLWCLRGRSYRSLPDRVRREGLERENCHLRSLMKVTSFSDLLSRMIFSSLCPLNSCTQDI